MQYQQHYIQQRHHGQQEGHRDHPSHRPLHPSAPSAPSPHSTPLVGPTHPALQPGNSYSSNAASRYYATSNAAPSPQTSRGRDYLRSIGPAVADLDQQFASLDVRNNPSNLNKPLPDPPRNASTAGPPFSQTAGHLSSRPYSSPSLDHARCADETVAGPHSARPPAQTQLEGHLRVERYPGDHTPPTTSPAHHITSRPFLDIKSSSSQSRPIGTTPLPFRPSTHAAPPHLRPPPPESRLPRPYSDPLFPGASAPRTKAKASSKTTHKSKRKTDTVYIVDSDDDDTSSSDNDWVTSRSPARRRRAASERPRGHVSLSPTTAALTSRNVVSPGMRTPTRSSKGDSVQCSGYTKEGQRCKRMAKAKAAYFDMVKPTIIDGDGDRSGERGEARYCKDHANLVIDQPGFSWMGSDVYIRYSAHLGQQTQAVLRVTMESPLTAKESPGYLYAYELRDLKTPNTSYFKVGRTDNPARRISEWTNRCTSHTPTLRDVYPLVKRTQAPRPADDIDAGLQRNPTLPTSYLLGAFRHSENPDRCCPASKRWERLVHLELADLALQHAPMEYEGLKKRCEQCQAVHQEIFPLGTGEGVYELRVKEVICRWERFVRTICARDGRPLH